MNPLPTAHFRTALSALPLAAALALPAAHAQSNVTWNGGTSRDWTTAANWSPGIPAEGDNLIISDSTTNGITLNDASHAIGNFQFGTTATRTSGFSFRTLTNTLTIEAGLTASGNFTGVGPSFYGNVTLPYDQVWSISGEIGSHTADRGVFIREVTNAAGDRTGVAQLVLNGDLNKSGSGQLVIAATTISGPGDFIVDQGALKLNAGASSLLTVGGEGNITVRGSAQVFVSRNSGTMSITRPIILNDTAGMVWGGGAASTNTVASPIAWDGTTHTLDVPTSTIGYISSGTWTTSGATVNRTGAGPLTLTGDNSGFTGTLNLNGSGTTNFDSPFGGSVTVGNGTANLNTSVAGPVTVNGGRANLNSPPAGNVTLGGAGALAGETTAGGNLTLNGGNLYVNPTTTAALGCTGNLLLTGTNTVNLTANPTSSAPFAVLAYTGTRTGGAANLTLAGGAGNYRTPTFSDASPGIITLALASESRTWTGAMGNAQWDINGSTNWAEGDQRFFQLDAVTFTDTGAGTVAVTGTVIPTSITVDSSSDYTFTMASASDLIAGAATLTKRGSGTLTLGGTNTFSGGVTVEAGTLKAAASAALGANGNTITVLNGATLDHNSAWGVNRDFNAVIAGDGVDGLGAIVNNGTQDQQAGFRSLTLTADASIGGIYRFDVRPITAGTGLVDLAGHTLTKLGINKISLVDGTLANDGTIEITEGTLSFTRMVVSGSGPVNVHPYATLQFENYSAGSFAKDIAADDATVLTTGNALVIDSDVAVTNTATFQCDVQLTIDGTVTGTGTLSKLGGSTLVLAGDATHAGQTIVNAGTLQIGNGGTTGTLAADIDNYATVAFNRSDDVSFANAIWGTGGLTKLGAGTLTLAATQQYTGTTTVTAGTLKLAAGDNTLAPLTPVTLANTAGATLDLNGTNQEIRSLGGGGTTGGMVSNSGAGAAVLTIRPTGTDNVTFSGTLADNVRLVVAGDKTAPSYSAPRQRLAGTANTYAGGTLVDGGTLLARTDASLGAIPAAFDPANITLQNNGTLLNEADNFALTLDPNRGITLGPGGGAMVAGFTANVTVQGAITGAAGNTLTILENRNTVVLTADNNYLGDTIINGPGANGTGRLQIGDGGTTGTLGAGNVTNNGALTFNRSDAISYNGSISGTGTVTQAGAGTLTLNGANSCSGNTTVSAGTLELGTTGALRFVPTANATSNMLTGTGTAVLKGTFNLDLAGAQIANGNSWTLVNTATLAVTYDPSFNVAGFTQAADVWTLVDGAKTWTFDETTGILSLTAAGFFDWIGGFIGLPDTTPGGDPDHDGIDNLLEYVLNGDPSLSDPDILPTLDASGPNFVFTFTRSVDSTADTAQVFQYGSDLATWTNVNITAPTGPEVTLGTPSGGLQLVTVTIPKSAAVDGKLFGRLVVSLP